MSELVKQYLENEKQINTLYNELHEFMKVKETEIHSVKWNEYEPKIRAVMEERDKKIEAIRDQQISKESETRRAISELNIVRDQVNRILLFLQLRARSESFTIEDSEIHAYDGRHIEILGYIFDDQFLKIKLFIIENSKPKNKYSLIAFGKCLFPESLLKVDRDYGIDTHEDNYCSLRVLIRDMPTISDLRAYLDRNKSTILAMLVQNYQQVKEDYLDIIEKYRVEDFIDLIGCRCECGFFYTKEEARNYTRRSGFMGEHQEPVKCPLCKKVMVLQSSIPQVAINQ